MKKNLLALGMIAAALTSTSFAKPGHGGHGGHGGPGFNPGKRVMTVTIPMNGQEALRGQTTIKLKQEIKKLRPALNLAQADLTSVTVRAKSAAGRGTVYIQEGYFQSRQKTIDMSPQYQGFNKAGGFSDVTMNTPRDLKQVVWQAHLQGNIKVKKIDVTFELPGQVEVQAQCGAVLQGVRGRIWDTFFAQAKAQNQRQAKALACQKAMDKCRAKKRNLSSQHPNLGRMLSCYNN